MRDLKELLGPLADQEMPDRWDAIQRREPSKAPEPRHRSRIPVYAVSVAAAALVVLLVVRLAPMGGNHPAMHASRPGVSALALWPQNAARVSSAGVIAKARAIETRGASGAAAWQLDPSETARRFARVVFGWPDVLVVGTEENPDGSVAVTLGRTTTCSSVGADGATGTSSPCPIQEHVVTVAQPLTRGEGGAWEVVEVHPVTTSEFDLGVARGDTLVAGQRLRFAFGDVPPGTVGLVFTSGCRTQQITSRVEVVDANTSTAMIDVPSMPSNNLEAICGGATGSGYLYAYSTEPPGSSVTLGSPLTAHVQIGEASIVPIMVSAPGSASTVPTPTNSPPASPVPTGTEQVIGYHGVLVSVPASWAINATTCGTPNKDTVIRDQGGTLTCLVSRLPGISSVEFVDDPSQWLSNLQVTTDTSSANGVALRLGTIQGRQGEAVWVPDVSVLLMIVAHPAELRQGIIDSVQLADDDPNGCAMHVTELMPPPVGDAGTPSAGVGLADEVVTGSPTAITICHYVDDWLASSATVTGEQMATLVNVINGLPRGFAYAPTGSYLPSSCNESASAGGERGSGYILHVEGGTSPPALWAHVGICGPLGITNGVRSGQLTPEFAKLLNAPLHHGYEMPGRLVSRGG